MIGGVLNQRNCLRVNLPGTFTTAIWYRFPGKLPKEGGLSMNNDSVLVSGLINIETTVRIDRFPIEYAPVHYPFFGVASSVSGVGFNVAKALRVLGRPIRFLSLVGRDWPGERVLSHLPEVGLDSGFVRQGLEQTPQSVILYDPSGRRQIHVDLKNVQETSYPETAFAEAVKGVAGAALCNINFSRPFLRPCRDRGLRIAVDVHAISDLHDEYNRDFMAAADILFQSDEKLPCSPGEWAEAIHGTYGTDVVVIGMGRNGAYLSHRSAGVTANFPAAIPSRPVVNTIGAGDALFSCFLHFFLKTSDSVEALRLAQLFAAWKIGETGAASGFLSEEECLCRR
jgi:ribokinase